MSSSVTRLALAAVVTALTGCAGAQIKGDTFTARFPAKPDHRATPPVHSWTAESGGVRYHLAAFPVLFPSASEEEQLSAILLSSGEVMVRPATARWLTLRFPSEEHAALEVDLDAAGPVGRMRAFLIDGLQYELTVLSPPPLRADVAATFFDGFVHARAGHPTTAGRAAPSTTPAANAEPAFTAPPLLTAAASAPAVAAKAPGRPATSAPAATGGTELAVLRTERDFFGPVVTVTSALDSPLTACELRLPTGVTARLASLRPRETVKVALGNFTADQRPADPAFAQGWAVLSCRGASGYARFVP